MRRIQFVAATLISVAGGYVVEFEKGHTRSYLGRDGLWLRSLANALPFVERNDAEGVRVSLLEAESK